MKKQIGLTLIELMVSMALGLIIIAAAMNIYIRSIKMSGDTLKSARLNHDLGMAMSLMTNDIKRAGFWGNAGIEVSSLDNPFTTATDFTIGTSVSANDCILYTYDADGIDGDADGSHLDTNEYFGFRRYLNTTTNTHTVQIRSTNVACNATGAAWQSMTDENMINVTSLQFSFAPLAEVTATEPNFSALTGTSRCLNFDTSVTSDALTCSPAPTTGQYVAQKRVVNIRITGQLIGADNAEVIKGLSDTVKVRNNRVYKQ